MLPMPSMMPDSRRYMPPPAYYPYPYIPYPMHPPPMHMPQAGDKRPAPDSDDAQGGKQKKSKGKPKAAVDNTNGSSRRGYSAKKRNDAAQMAAQNARVVSYPGDKASDSASANKDQAPADGQPANGPEVLAPELQYARCMSNRYKEEVFPRCVSCTRRWAGDTCRFQGIRYFLKDSKRDIVGISFVEATRPDLPSMNFPAQWNIDIQPKHMRATKITVARALLPILEKEVVHLAPTEVIRRQRESDVRATCDTCMTSIFSSTWMCRICGREACSECFEQVRELTTDKPGAGQAEIAALQARREKHAHSNPFFLSCTRRNEHTAKDFCPVSRFCKLELEAAIKEMKKLLAEVDGAPTVSSDPNETNESASSDNASGRTPTTNGENAAPASVVPEASPANGSTTASGNGNVRTSSDSDPPLPTSTAPPAFVPTNASEVPCYEPIRYTADEMTDELFMQVWKRGEPLVVTSIMPKFEVQWTPEYFIEKYGSQACLIIECQTDANKRVTVAEFFEQFGQYKEKRECWKLKDWPPSSDFKSAFPELYDDFSNAVPVPNFVRRDGVLNIASHFPSNTVAPDLGKRC
ncbi:hypothetical protein HGRIS_009823 [Hohenbuehelia grisea]|uniref:Uncharacterized protein n=1 Tax=Hohenbuehelia grisea TaxID=104357 RepID=A0ABR3J2U2_9AGAR